MGSVCGSLRSHQVGSEQSEGPLPTPPTPEPVSPAMVPRKTRNRARLSSSPRTAQPFPSRPTITSLEFLKEACPDAHAYTSDIIHSSLGPAAQDMIPQRNGFVHTVLECYNQHRALTIRPDDVWIAIITQFSCFVNGNAEALRCLFVLHYDKKELSVNIDQAEGKEDWDFVIQATVKSMKEQIHQNVIDPELKQWMIPAFSTTNLTDELVAGMVMMATVKEYFSYRIVLLCGIPRVTLEGKKEDWIEILNRIEKLKEFGPQTTTWYRLLHPVLSRFVMSFDGQSGAVGQELWSKVVHYRGYGSGSTLICGWITAFMVFDENGGWKGDNKSDLILDGITYPGIDSDEIPAGYAQVDVILQRDLGGLEHPTSLIAGSIGTKIFSSGDKTLSETGERDSAMPALGWWFVFKKSTEPQQSIFTPGTPRWRFVDARAFMYSGAIRLVCHEDIDNLDFVAISYVWTDAIRKWINYVHSTGGHTFEEKITQGSGMFSASTPSTDGLDADVIVRAKLFFTIVAFFVLARGKKFFWIDVLCIDQGEQKEKSFFIPRMGDLYRRAAETHAYPFGASIPSSIFSDEVHFPIWETRAWTVQEHILSRSLLFCYAFPGDVRQEFKNIRGDPEKSGPEFTVEPHTPVLDKYQYAGGIYLLHTKENTLTCNIQQEMWGNLSTDAWVSVATDSSFRNTGQNDTRRFLTRGSAYKALSEMKKSHISDITDVARTCMIALSSGRQSTLPEDMMYSILGVLDLRNFFTEYNIGFEEARLRIFEALSPKILASIIGTEWGNGSTTDALKDSALPRVVGATPIVGIIDFLPAIQNCKYTRNIGVQMKCRRETFRVWAPDEHTKADQGFLRTSLKEGLLLLQIASVFDTPEAASMPTGTIPRDLTNVIIADMSTFGVRSDEEASRIDMVAEFVEVGVCYPGAILLPSLFTLNNRRALLTLHCEKTASGTLVNKGTVLILDASAFSTTYGDVVVE